MLTIIASRRKTLIDTLRPGATFYGAIQGKGTSLMLELKEITA